LSRCRERLFEGFSKLKKIGFRKVRVQRLNHLPERPYDLRKRGIGLKKDDLGYIIFLHNSNSVLPLQSLFEKGLALPIAIRRCRAKGGIGSLAQLVQSICLTSRGSGVRTPQLPH
jgi:hypothetical protein